MSRPKKRLFIVLISLAALLMGGAAYGEVASEIAVQTLRKYEKKLKHADGTRMLDQLVSSYTTEANNAICDMLTEKHCQTGGTTFPCFIFWEMR